jgi:hypothetical protein
VTALLDFIDNLHYKFKQSFDYAKSYITRTNASAQKLLKTLKIIEDNYASLKSQGDAAANFRMSPKKKGKVANLKNESQVKGMYTSIKKVLT